MGHKWTKLAVSKGISKPTAKRTQKGPKELLRGIKWGEFFSAPENKVIIEGEEFKLRIGFFFTIPACCILHNGKYMVLRKISKKAWNVGLTRRILIDPANPFPWDATMAQDTEGGGNWWYQVNGHHKAKHYSSQPEEGFVLAKSKFDILRK